MAMAGTVTRSRRADSSHISNSSIVNTRRLLANAKEQAFHTISSPPRKRPAPQRDFDNIVAKKARFTTGIAVEIPARPSFHARLSREPTDAKPAPPAITPKPAVAAPNPPTTRHAAPLANGDEPPKSTATSARQRPTRTEHQEKVANGLKHELSRLQPNAEDSTHQGRKLRSQEATRFKSELSAYFPEYDEVIGNDPKETHLLNLDTPIVITDEAPPGSPSQQHQLHHHQPHPPETAYPIRSYSDALYTDLFDAQRIDFSFLNQNINAKKQQHHPPPPHHVPPSSDPLPDTLYTFAHRKAERLERSIRNTEKGRAQHERDQIIRLLDGLQGPDWLRVMGVSGVTESRKRAFEPAREHFIKGCEGILEKFRRWAAEEKRMRLERLQKREEEGHSVGDGSTSRDDGDGDDDDEVGGGSEVERDGSGEDGEDDEKEEGGEPPDDDNHDSDVDAEIAKQLREEALAAAVKGKGRRKKFGGPSRRGVASRCPPPPKVSELPEEPPREFTSFFAKRYQRDAALSKTRRTGRKVLAWGHPVPDMPERDFELPAELRDEDTLRARARMKRREKRVRK
ncbi:something about silencing, SAS, complex subunit 4-domain-containing protein [Achaetomium macrosporum]|uniref:Something about silencing, SAS, complex subunit 4-domain-containing protein n=1 Tax=Achaetomium macrosporum TaxID=79813 RepID=A0AAN7C508_9PEZI|nr:something about silencing, SAS, complex subunit 4-domain-containing protein [Achaetomium macrosporum]